MMNRKPWLKPALGIALTVQSLLCGCGNSAAQPEGTAVNDILTFKPVDQDKMMITVRTCDVINSVLIEQVLEARFPEADVVVNYNTVEESDFVYQDYGDLYFSAQKKLLEKSMEKAFVDLSSQSFTSNFYQSALNDISINGHIYCVPGPVELTGIVYDKELFSENGWEVPAGLSEFITLCHAIEETGIRAFAPTLRYNAGVKSFVTGFCYQPVYSGVDNYQWVEDFNNGRAGMTGHMEPAFETMEMLLDEGIWNLSDFELLPVERTNMLYRDHTCAMTVETQQAPVYARKYGEGKEREVGMMPFFSGDGPDSDYLISTPNYYVGVNKSLEAPGSEERLEKAIEMVAYLSSPEGQSAVIPDDAPMMPSVKGTQAEEAPFMEACRATIEKGNLVQAPLFGSQDISSIDIAFSESFRSYFSGEISLKDALQDVDRARDAWLEEDTAGNSKEIVGTAGEDFTRLELSEYLADAFRRKTGAEIGLCNANSRESGNHAKLYAGPIYSYTETSTSRFAQEYAVNRGFYDGEVDDNGHVLMLVEMRGAAIREQLNALYRGDSSYPSVYTVASGLKVEFAPWAGDGKRLVGVTLENGGSLEDGELYRVAVWNGSVKAELIENIVKIYDEPFMEIFEDAVRADGEIVPFKDGRFVLNWDLVEEAGIHEH